MTGEEIAQSDIFGFLQRDDYETGNNLPD